ncbi:MAG: PKD domain-containing protein, partial [Bacteroidota bacterium]
MRFKVQLLLLLIFSVHLTGQAPHAFLIEGETEACQGDSVVAYLQIVGGTAPYTVEISYTPWGKITLKDISSPYDLWLKPEYNTTYSISSVKDFDGVPGTFQGYVNMKVYPVTPVQIVMDHTLYYKSDPAVPLVSNPVGAVFQGNGVLGNNFYPAYAPPEESPHQISCIYENTYGCPAYDTIGITVIYGEAEVVLVSGEEIINTVCDEGAAYEIRGSNQDSIPGLFALRKAGSGQFLSGYIVDEDSSDNVAAFHPAGLTGTYELVYTYEIEGLTITGTWQVNVNDIESLTIEGFPDLVCNGDNPYLLTPGNISYDPGSVYSISGPGISGNQYAGYYFDPGDESALTGDSKITMEYASSNGCSTVVSKTVTNHFTPGVSFTYAPSCLSSSGGTVTFNNTSTGKYAVAQWVWDFGDPESGSLNHSNLEQPQHFYAIPGVKPVSLTAHTTDGCVAAREQDAVLSDQPMADLTWLHDCYVKGQRISFLDRSVSNYSQIESLQWTFKTEGGLVLGVLESIHPEDTIRFPFTSQDNYQIQLKVWDQAGCFDQTTKELSLRPTIPVTTSGYRENFNGSSSAWKSGAEDQSSWVLGLPAFTGFESVPEDYAWYTDLPSGDSQYLEQSWVESPCFDFRQSIGPQLSLDMMKSFRPGLDGAVMQYQEGTG